MVDELLDAATVAGIIGCSESILQSWVRAGRIPAPIKLSGRLIRWRKSDMDIWIAAGCPRSKPRKADPAVAERMARMRAVRQSAKGITKSDTLQAEPTPSASGKPLTAEETLAKQREDAKRRQQRYKERKRAEAKAATNQADKPQGIFAGNPEPEPLPTPEDLEAAKACQGITRQESDRQEMR